MLELESLKRQGIKSIKKDDNKKYRAIEEYIISNYSVSKTKIGRAKRVEGDAEFPFGAIWVEPQYFVKYNGPMLLCLQPSISELSIL